MEIGGGGSGGGGGAALTVTDGITPVVNVTTIDFTAGATVTNAGGGTVNVSISGASNSFVDNEVVSGSGTTFTLANTPIVGSQHVYANGQRLTPTADYTIAAAVITMVSSWATGAVLCDYRK